MIHTRRKMGLTLTRIAIAVEAHAQSVRQDPPTLVKAMSAADATWLRAVTARVYAAMANIYVP